MFKKPSKKANANDSIEVSTDSKEADKKQTELDLIFNLDSNGIEIPKEIDNQENNEMDKEKINKKILLNDENESDVKYGLQEPPVKKRYIDGPTSKTTSVSAAKVLAREAKCGNKKLLSFYDDEEEEIENKDSSDDE